MYLNPCPFVKLPSKNLNSDVKGPTILAELSSIKNNTFLVNVSKLSSIPFACIDKNKFCKISYIAGNTLDFVKTV